MPNIDSLNERYGIKNRVTVSPGPDNMPWVRLEYRGAEVGLCLQGAHICFYRPMGGQDVLWTSSSALYEKNKAIRGGIPLCWPWFGPHPENEERPQHGYARSSMFSLSSTTADDNDTCVSLSLDPDAAPFPEWVGRLRLDIEIRLSDRLQIEMSTENLSRDEVTLSSALHSYFNVGDVRSIRVPQLNNCEYFDKVSGRSRHDGDFEVRSEVDRVYSCVADDVDLVDPALSRSLSIQNLGARNLVVWNPWADKAKNLADFDSERYLNMVCLEAANVEENTVVLLPGDRNRLVQSIKLNR